MNLFSCEKLNNLVQSSNSFTQIKHPTSNHIHSIWTLEEDLKLKELMTNTILVNKWKQISNYFDGKTPKQCYYHWNKVLMPQLNIKDWTIEEDRTIVTWVLEHGTSDWNDLSIVLKNRSPKSCKLRWYTTLSLNLSEKRWTTKEEFLLLLLVSNFGLKWDMIITQFPDKTENEIKNKFYLSLRKFAKRALSQNYNLKDFNVFRLKSDELIKFLPHALKDYHRKLNEVSPNTNLTMCNPNCSTNAPKENLTICKFCGDKLKRELREILKRKIKVAEVAKNTKSEWINSNLMKTSEKLKNFMNLLSNFSQNLNN